MSDSDNYSSIIRSIRTKNNWDTTLDGEDRKDLLEEEACELKLE